MRRTDVWDELFRMRDEMDSLFGDFFTDFSPRRNLLIGSQSLSKDLKKPLMDVYEEGNNFVVKADLPGYDKKDIQLNVKDGVLEIKAENKNEQELNDKKKGTYKFERNYSGYYRQIALPENIDENKITAEYKNGVLSLNMPKTHQIESKNKQIDIK
ncbi:Hsp20/alpha crystallin family protein [Candidatus Woesearchaeota archaeon]|nr:Hsp20/alpha crystallin family protein [Candidatus Woesearchaeota archaeon]